MAMLPFYLIGNIHCIGMCGPLVVLIRNSAGKYAYLLGRAISFTIAGTLAGYAGAVLNSFLHQWRLAALACFLFGGIMIAIGCFSLLKWSYPGYRWLAKRTASVSQHLAMLVSRHEIWPSFLFGFFTILLPCGQTLVVFSACALSGDSSVGMINGAAFALLTSPALLLAMQTHRLIGSLKSYYNTFLGVASLIAGGLAICRGLAEMEIIPHLILSSRFHLVLY